ncbi:MAG: flagellar assembly protein FliH [Treponemataceae bacterium]|nr:flagellar assembly protein FliH [Treponemataceae bacterium]
MARRQVFTPGEVKKKDDKFELRLLHEYAKPVVEEVVEETPVYTGPTVEELQKEADDFKAKWEAEKQQMLAAAQADADSIVERAKEAAFNEVKNQTDHAQEVKAQAEREAADIVQKAKDEAAQIIADAQAQQDALAERSQKDGYEQGRTEGYDEGKAEVGRLIERTHAILDEVISRREEILRSTEQQIVELVILMTRKVVKLLSESQKNVVMANVLEALKKVRGRGKVNIRVNLADLKLTTEHAQNFVRQFESVEGVSVYEDSSVDKGGCVVETDFGAIDARIASQLGELESKVLEISPVKTLNKGGGSSA